MKVIALSKAEAEAAAHALLDGEFQFLVAIDDIDDSFKVKTDGGTWSPPMGSKW